MHNCDFIKEHKETDKFYFQWHITDQCNLRCSHCYQESYTSSSDLPLEEIKSIADNIFKVLLKWGKKGDISITGGEPFIRNDFFQILEYIESSKDIADMYILSNGILVNKETVSKLKYLTKLRSVQISLEGSTAHSHDSIRGYGTFEKALKAIRILLSNDIDVKLMFTLQKTNMNDVPALIDLALSEGVSGLTIERVVPIGSAKKNIMLTPEELRDIFQYISDRADQEYEKGSKLKILKYRPLWINIDPSRAKKDSHTIQHRELGASCSIGLDGLCILPDATVLACRRLNIPIGNLKKDSIEKIWFTSELLWQIRDKSNLKGKCKSCEYIPCCGGCRAVAYSCTGDYLEADPQCWK